MATTPLVKDITKLKIGRAKLFVGDYTTEGGLTELAMTEGATTASPESKFSTLTLPELSGDAPLRVDHMGDAITVDLSFLIGDSALWAKLAPRGKAAGGVSKPAEVTYTSLLIVPVDELDDTGSLAYGGGPPKIWTPDVPENAILIPKGYFAHPKREYEYNDQGSKKATAAQFVGVQDESLPEGYKLWIQGTAFADFETAGGVIAI